ncbi:hypothetical protein EX30DRAFT_2488 [Ascodesmis nigricans]|uniref:Uncharacterized protein n=1 Tax=Ascodesmis nigricans TaxID=341454 RepID=A0A4S2N650_9PEZI|nr:hypothetical protein EX30DRAFT_2488 [Ascodesmis nigricans]
MGIKLKASKLRERSGGERGWSGNVGWSLCWSSSLCRWFVGIGHVCHVIVAFTSRRLAPPKDKQFQLPVLRHCGKGRSLSKEQYVTEASNI